MPLPIRAYSVCLLCAHLICADGSDDHGRLWPAQSRGHGPAWAAPHARRLPSPALEPVCGVAQEVAALNLCNGASSLVSVAMVESTNEQGQDVC